MIQIDKTDLHEKCMVPQKVIHPGDELYVFCRHGLGGHKSFYVKALVEEVIYIWVNYDDEDSPSIWHSAFLDGVHELTTSTGEKSPLGWDIPRKVPPEEFEKLRKEQGLKIVNQMPWVDWPIGHAAYIGDDGFFTLEDARQRYGRFSKRKLGRRVRHEIRNVTGFIASTWKMGGHGNHPGFPPLESWMRKGYV